MAVTSPFPDVAGRIKYEVAVDGESEIDFSAWIEDIPDGGEVTVMWGDLPVLAAAPSGGVARRDLKTKDGDDVAPIGGGIVELVCDDVIIATAHAREMRLVKSGRFGRTWKAD